MWGEIRKRKIGKIIWYFKVSKVEDREDRHSGIIGSRRRAKWCKTRSRLSQRHRVFLPRHKGAHTQAIMDQTRFM